MNFLVERVVRIALLYKDLNRLINFSFTVSAVLFDHLLQSFNLIIFLLQVALHLADFGDKILYLKS